MPTATAAAPALALALLALCTACGAPAVEPRDGVSADAAGERADAEPARELGPGARCATDASCAAGTRCRSTPAPASTRVCGAAEITAPVVEDFVLFEGEATPGVPVGPFAIEAPADVVSLTLIAQNVGEPGVAVAVASLRGPDGATLIDAERWDNVHDQPVREPPWRPDVNTALVPSSDSLAVQPGRYRVSFAFDDARGRGIAARAVVRIKRAPGGVVARGTLHLRIFMVGVAAAGGPDAASAPGDPRIQDALRGMRETFGAVGVDVVVDSFHDAGAADAERFADLELRDAGELYALGGAAGGDVLDVFVVRRFVYLLADSEVGISADVAGPPGIHGTRSSGVAVSWEQTLGRDRDLLGLVLAHEAGHFLGLWHAREALPPCAAPGASACAALGGVDPLVDTPDGPEASQNVMFWSVSSPAQSLSPGQGRVLRGSALVR